MLDTSRRQLTPNELASASPSGLIEKDTDYHLATRKYRACRTHILTTSSTARAGFYSKSKWRRSGRDICTSDRPTLCVATAWRTYHPADTDFILGYSDANEYVVSNPRYDSDLGMKCCWEVFHEGQTVERTTQLADDDQQRERENSDEQENAGIPSVDLTTTSPFTTSSYDGNATAETTANSSHTSHLQQSDSRTHLITEPTSSRGRDILVYFPEGFDWEEYPELQPYRSSVLWFAHKLHERRFVNADGTIYGADDFITIKSDYARQIDPKFRDVIKLLFDLEVIERDFYDPQRKSYGYRFVDASLRHATRRRVPLNDPKLAKRINRHRKKQATTTTDRWLRSQLFKIGLDEIDEAFLTVVAGASVRENGGAIQDKLDAYRYVLERIGNAEHMWKPDNQGRRYSLITNLKRELRSLLRVEGQRLQQIDICNSQLLFLALEMKRVGIDCPNFSTLCEQGILYETVAEKARTTRSAAKKAITQRALFSTNEAPCQRSKVKRAFDRLFPEVAKFLYESKDEPDGNKKLAKLLQFAEADLIINQVCGRLRRENHVQFVTPVHDSLLFLPQDAPLVKSVMEDEFSKLGVHPQLAVNDL